MAHDFYAWARASLDPSKKQKLVKSADAYLKQAEELRRGHVIQAAFPKRDAKIGQGRGTPWPPQLAASFIKN